MLKYTDTKVVFREIPDEITLAINISGCPCACEGCHSSYLAGDVGEELSQEAVCELIAKNDMVSCVSFMGGDGDPAAVSLLAEFVKAKFPGLAVGWYSGRDELSPLVDLANFDFVKIGSYRSEFGALDSTTTNQRLYKVVEGESLVDITYLMTK